MAGDAVPAAVGFVGLGNIGAPWPVTSSTGRVAWWCTTCSRRPPPFAESGATVAASNTEVAERCGVISVMVLDGTRRSAWWSTSCSTPRRRAP